MFVQLFANEQAFQLGHVMHISKVQSVLFTFFQNQVEGTVSAAPGTYESPSVLDSLEIVKSNYASNYIQFKATRVAGSKLTRIALPHKAVQVFTFTGITSLPGLQGYDMTPLVKSGYLNTATDATSSGSQIRFTAWGDQVTIDHPTYFKPPPNVPSVNDWDDANPTQTFTVDYNNADDFT